MSFRSLLQIIQLATQSYSKNDQRPIQHELNPTKNSKPSQYTNYFVVDHLPTSINNTIKPSQKITTHTTQTLEHQTPTRQVNVVLDKKNLALRIHCQFSAYSIKAPQREI